MTFAEKLSGAIANLDINNVFMCDAEVKLSVHPTIIKPENTTVNVDDVATWSLNRIGDVLLCQVNRTLKGTCIEVPGSPAREVLLIKVSYMVQYTLLDPGKKADPHTYDVFAKTNAVYNSYPYFREFIHSVCNRMGVQPIVMSFLKPYTMKQILEAFPEPAQTTISE